MKKVYCSAEYSIEMSKFGYYTLFVNGKFEGNYDSVTEAIQEIERIKTQGFDDLLIFSKSLLSSKSLL